MNQNENRPIVIRRVKKVVGGGHHGGAWKVAYADFVTAMMAFFMLLWLISSPDKEQLKGLAEYFSPAPPSAPSTNGQTVSDSSVVSQGGHTQRMKGDSRKGGGEPAMLASSAGVARGGSADFADASLRVKAEELRLAIDSTRQDDDPKVNMEAEGDNIRLSLTDNDRHAMFMTNSATLNAWGRSVLARVIPVLKQSEFSLSIEGHTDGDGTGSAANYELSAQRAYAVRQALVAGGISAGRIGALTAMADSKPVYPDQPGRAENRRITVILSSDGKPLPDSAEFHF